jgi:hypothetical protein
MALRGSWNHPDRETPIRGRVDCGGWSAVDGAPPGLSDRRSRTPMLAAHNGFREAVPSSIHLMDAQHLLQLGVPDPARLFADALRLADLAVTGLR